eukprot:7086078-Pyramimonas_sp.AAC.1
MAVPPRSPVSSCRISPGPPRASLNPDPPRVLRTSRREEFRVEMVSRRGVFRSSGSPQGQNRACPPTGGFLDER